jgi:hypothetical protein
MQFLLLDHFSLYMLIRPYMGDPAQGFGEAVEEEAQ